MLALHNSRNTYFFVSRTKNLHCPLTIGYWIQCPAIVLQCSDYNVTKVKIKSTLPWKYNERCAKCPGTVLQCSNYSLWS